MKSPLSILCVAAAFVAASPLAIAGDSKKTADYLTTTPAEFEGKDVTIDVACIKPVNWKSPVAELTFFQAMTIDRLDKRPGGAILVAVASEDAAKVAKKYGTTFDARFNSTPMKGTFLASPGHARHGSVWFIDTSGKAQELIEKNILKSLESSPEPPPRGPGPGGRFRPPTN